MRSDIAPEEVEPRGKHGGGLACLEGLIHVGRAHGEKGLGAATPNAYVGAWRQVLVHADEGVPEVAHGEGFEGNGPGEWIYKSCCIHDGGRSRLSFRALLFVELT